MLQLGHCTRLLIYDLTRDLSLVFPRQSLEQWNSTKLGQLDWMKTRSHAATVTFHYSIHYTVSFHTLLVHKSLWMVHCVGGIKKNHQLSQEMRVLTEWVWTMSYILWMYCTKLQLSSGIKLYHVEHRLTQPHTLIKCFQIYSEFYHFVMVL